MNELTAKVSEMWTECVLYIISIKQSYCIG